MSNEKKSEVGSDALYEVLDLEIYVSDAGDNINIDFKHTKKKEISLEDFVEFLRVVARDFEKGEIELFGSDEYLMH